MNQSRLICILLAIVVVLVLSHRVGMTVRDQKVGQQERAMVVAAMARWISGFVISRALMLVCSPMFSTLGEVPTPPEPRG